MKENRVFSHGRWVDVWDFAPADLRGLRPGESLDDFAARVKDDPQSVQPHRGSNLFVRVPEHWLRRLTALTPGQRWLGVILLWKAFRSRKSVFPCGSLEDWGIGERLKRDGLAALEAAGMIAVDRSDHRCPHVKII
jgi:hypothetical protein